jgi:hypothetical protein
MDCATALRYEAYSSVLHLIVVVNKENYLALLVRLLACETLLDATGSTNR